ncbi:hypothetical protein [Neptunomonas sp. XY-337]|uniref:hypothetical protein n=1 Tax=Neptunomonas sp. XY-337 TaxID=2561897 RepID=UPI0010AAECB1|nr:hypothetical protein [Neptunomonas sp. XY-337]
METFIIVFVVLSLIGSAMWMMPTRREKEQAKLRMKARQEGFQVQLVRLTAPRAQGELDEETRTVPGYRLLRTNIERRLAEELPAWQVFRVTSIANEGLPSDWSWKLGERVLDTEQLAVLEQVLSGLPRDVVALESTPIQVTAFWREDSGDESLDKIKVQLNRLMEAKL